MSEGAEGRSRVVGKNQSLKVIRSGKAKKVMLARDADSCFSRSILEEAKKVGLTDIDITHTSQELAKQAGVEVPTAIITEYETDKS